MARLRPRGLARSRTQVGVWVLAGQQAGGPVGLLLDPPPEPAQRHEPGDRHDHAHPVEHLSSGSGEVGADELRDAGDVAVPALQLSDLAGFAEAAGPGSPFAVSEEVILDRNSVIRIVPRMANPRLAP